MYSSVLNDFASLGDGRRAASSQSIPVPSRGYRNDGSKFRSLARGTPEYFWNERMIEGGPKRKGADSFVRPQSADSSEQEIPQTFSV